MAKAAKVLYNAIDSLTISKTGDIRFSRPHYLGACGNDGSHCKKAFKNITGAYYMKFIEFALNPERISELFGITLDEDTYYPNYLELLTPQLQVSVYLGEIVMYMGVIEGKMNPSNSRNIRGYSGLAEYNLED